MNDPFDTLVMNSKPLGEGVSCREELISLLKSHPELETTKLYHKRLFEPKRIPAFSLSVYESDEDNRPLSYIVRFKQQLDIGKTLGDCLIIPVKEATKVCHFVTFSDISQEQEETSLQTIFEVKVLDKTGRLTPDFHVDSGTIDIVEFATSASKHQQALVNTFNNKFVKYYDAIRLHSMNSGRNSRLFVIVVGREGLLSSLNLSDSLVSELIFRYRFSRAIAAKFSEIGVHQSHFDEDEGINYRNAKAMFESMDFNFDESGEWTKVNYENWISEITQFEIHNISRNIMHCFKEASDMVDKEEVMRSKPKIFLNSFSDESIKEFEDTHFLNGNTRKDLKPITIFPLFIPKTRSYYSSYDFKSIILNITGTDTMSMAWKMAIESAKTSENYQFEESITSSASTYINGCSYDLKNRALYKRVKLDLCESEWEDLATKGIRGKEFSKSSKYQEALAHSKGGFATSVDTSDIDDFLNSKELFDNHDSHPGYIDTLIDLIKRANVMAENDICTFSKDIVKTFDNFSRTGYFRYMCMITEIACELLMTLRQNCKKDQFVLKTLKFSNVLLLIRPTNSTEHIFFSLMSEVGDESVVHGLPFGRMNKSENLIYTDFVSANSQQLSHWAISAPMSLVFLQVWMKYCDMQYCQFLDKESFLNVDSEFSKMMNLSMLIFLEQKASTEEVLTLFRYGSMECFKDKPGFCNPLKILDKMPTMFRSRLTSWAYKKLITEMKTLTGKGYKQVKNDAVKAKVTKIKTIWKNLRNPYTESRVSDPSKLVNLFYLGYLRNKHTKTNSNQDLALISKILKGEKEYLTASDRDSLGSCYFNPEFKHNPHNYDVGFCKVLTAYLKRGYHMRTGESISNVIEREFITSLINHSPDVFMTLKASSSFKPGDEDLLLGEVRKAAKVKSKRSKNIEPCTVFDVQDTLLSDAEILKDDKVVEDKPGVRINTSRPRVIEEFSDVVKDYDPVIMFLPNAMKVCSEHGLMIDIFKKPQQGGLREIYVLTRESRMVQFTIEHLSRIICSTFESETMTHPKNKIRLMTDHGVLARKKTEDIIQDHEKRVKNKSSFCIINSNSSKDKKSWNNTNSPSKFAIMLLRLTPKMFHPFIFNSLKLWDKKQMLLPTGIQNILIKGLKWEIKDPIMNEFFKSYNQESSYFSETIHKSKPYITVKTGMMQGILHFTSSLMHTGFNLFVKSMFFGNCKKFSWIHDSIFTHLESSDDSAYLRTMWVDSKKRREALRFMYVNELFTTKICKLAGFHESMQKSSHHSSRVVEFNSEFCFDDQVYKPDMKFAFVCLRIPENESLSESCYQYKCLSSACLESGTTILGVHIIQIAQAFTHYLTLGLTLNPLFKPFSKHLIATTDPGIGFFPLDPCMLSGIVDHQFNVWMLLKGNPVFSMKTSTLLNTEKISSYSGGTLLKSAVLMFGDRRRWRSIINRMEDRIGHVDYREFVSKNPHLLFLRPSTSEERVAYQFLKMYTPSIISSLGNVGRMDRMLIRGGYAIQHKCLTLGSLWTDLLDNSNKESLSSLVRQLCNMVIKFIDNEQDIILNDDETEMIKTFREFISLDNEQNLHLLSEFDFDALRRDHSTAINSSIIRLADQRKIFPQLSDYISLLSNHRALCNSNWSVWDNKEKKRATVPVFEAPVQDLLSLENLCIYKWFNVIKHKLPESVITAQWNIFKAKYEWLRDTFQESFQASNFENEVSFANFIKMQLGKTRRMFVCSAPLKIEDGHSAIYSLMSRHFWPNMLLKALDTSKVLNKTSKDLIHPLATISTLKMSSQHRIDVYKSLTETHEEYKNLMNEFIDNNVSSSRELKLQPIIRLMRGDPKEIIDTCILRSKMGIVGSWVKQERFDRNTRRYSGKGLWEGRIDDLMLSVHTENARVTRMEASSGALFRLMFGSIRNWMREVRIDFADSYHIGNSEVDRVIACIRNNDIHDMITDKMCTPVFKSDKILSPNLESYSNYSINITNHSVQLRADMRRFVVEDEFSDNVTVLAVRLYDSDFLSNPMDYNFSGDILLSHLLSNRPFGVRKESLIEPQQLIVNTGVRRQNVVINTTKVVPFWEVSSCDNYTIGEFIKSFNDSIAETRRYDKEDLMKRLMEVYKFAIEAREIGDRFPSQILCKLLPSGFDYATNKNGLEFLRSLIPQLIREQRFRTQSVFPELLLKKALTSWSKVMSHTHLLDSEDILACITSLTGKPTVLIEKRALKWEVVLYAGGHLKDQLSRQLDSSNIIISCLDSSSRLHSTHLLRRSGPKVISYNKRLVKASSNVDPSKVSWDNIRSDLQAVRQLIHQNPGCIYNVRELKNQLQMWLCRSFYDAGLMSQGFIHDLTNVEWDTDEYVSERVMAPDAAEKDDDKTEDIGQDEDFDFNDEFDEFLESEDAEAYQEMFIGEMENNSYESDDSLDNLALDETHTKELHKYISEFERHVKMSIPNASLFDVVVAKLQRDFRGFFSDPNSNLVRHGVPTELFNVINYFMGGKLVMEQFDSHGW